MEQFLDTVRREGGGTIEMTKTGKRMFYALSSLRDRYDATMSLAAFSAALKPFATPRGAGPLSIHTTKKQVSFSIAGETRDTCFSCTRDVAPVTSGPVTCYFGGIKKHLLAHIAASARVVGCVAWLTDRALRHALAEKGGEVVVNNDKYNRPLGDREGMLEILRLPSAKSRAIMHNKFLVFLDARGKSYAVWTGSFNFSGNASRSLENAVYISDPVIANSYHEAWESMRGYCL